MSSRMLKKVKQLSARSYRILTKERNKKLKQVKTLELELTRIVKFGGDDSNLELRRVADTYASMKKALMLIEKEIELTNNS